MKIPFLLIVALTASLASAQQTRLVYTYLTGWETIPFDSPDVNPATTSPNQTVHLTGSFYLTQEIKGSSNNGMPWTPPFNPYTGPYDREYKYDVTGTVPKAGYHYWVHRDGLGQSGEQWCEEKLPPPAPTVLHKRYRNWYIPNGAPIIAYAP